MKNIKKPEIKKNDKKNTLKTNLKKVVTSIVEEKEATKKGKQLKKVDVFADEDEMSLEPTKNLEKPKESNSSPNPREMRILKRDQNKLKQIEIKF